MRLRINVAGIVQGVGFRPFIYRIATQNRLKGYVRNRGDAGVEILLEGEDQAIRNFLKDLREKKPSLARIHEMTKTRLRGKEEYSKFTIRVSSNERELSGSVIPPDIAVCSDCLRELRNPRDNRFDYFFITCTDCGPRFTTIEKLPYDRENTTMRHFPTCSFCQNEYEDASDRRFHAQTVACPKCGPHVYLTTREGEPVKCGDPIREAGELLSDGYIVAIKGYGGFHVAASTTRDKPLARLRETKHRSLKPFAIMARNLETIREFARLNVHETKLLTSYSQPIVLLDKSDNYYLSDLIAPDLHNVGVMLPYTGLHHMLFDRVGDPAFVMTSANPPNQPITKDNDEALRTLRSSVDYFLFHDRQIAHRCDDSVIRVHGKKPVFIRRSRGYAPAPVRLRKKARVQVVGLGGELNNTACVLNGNDAFISQHIGDVENVETRGFLEDAMGHLIGLTNSRVEAVACDLHPKFTTTVLAHDLASERGWQLIQVQHHYAHIAALMAEHDIKEMVGICCDGYGYGAEREAWGGEILFCSQETFGFKRLAHLEEQPLIGGDLAARYPLRMAAGILGKHVDIANWLLQKRQHFPHGQQEIRVILSQLKKSIGMTETTSCGRILDAVAAILGVCYARTYEGEPAMKLESVATKGKDVLKLKPSIKGNKLETTHLLLTIFENKNQHAIADLAYSAHTYLAEGLATLAVEKAVEDGIRTIGLSGGAACNRILTSKMQKTVRASGLSFLTHEAVPPGDGGLSFGQAVAVGFSWT